MLSILLAVLFIFFALISFLLVYLPRAHRPEAAALKKPVEKARARVGSNGDKNDNSKSSSASSNNSSDSEPPIGSTMTRPLRPPSAKPRAEQQHQTQSQHQCSESSGADRAGARQHQVNANEQNSANNNKLLHRIWAHFGVVKPPTHAGESPAGRPTISLPTPLSVVQSRELGATLLRSGAQLPLDGHLASGEPDRGGALSQRPDSSAPGSRLSGGRPSARQSPADEQRAHYATSNWPPPLQHKHSSPASHSIGVYGEVGGAGGSANFYVNGCFSHQLHEQQHAQSASQTPPNYNNSLSSAHHYGSGSTSTTTNASSSNQLMQPQPNMQHTIEYPPPNGAQWPPAAGNAQPLGASSHDLSLAQAQLHYSHRPAHFQQVSPGSFSTTTTNSSSLHNHNHIQLHQNPHDTYAHFGPLAPPVGQLELELAEQQQLYTQLVRVPIQDQHQSNQFHYVTLPARPASTSHFYAATANRKRSPISVGDHEANSFNNTNNNSHPLSAPTQGGMSVKPMANSLQWGAIDL